jgi:hypothetical protein
MITDFNDDKPQSAEARTTVTGLKFVSLHSTSTAQKQIIDNTSIGARIDGIAMEDAAVGVKVGYATKGRGKLIVDGSGTAIATSDRLKSGTGGIGVKAGTDKDKIGAIALAPSSAANDIIDVNVVIYDLAV